MKISKEHKNNLISELKLHKMEWDYIDLEEEINKEIQIKEV